MPQQVLAGPLLNNKPTSPPLAVSKISAKSAMSKMQGML